MSFFKKSSVLVSLLIVVIGMAFVLAWLNTSKFLSYSDLITVLTTTTATFGTLLGIITAGIMFTQGKFSELTSELDDKAPDYLAETISLEKIQSIETNLIALRKTFNELEATATVAEEKNLYKEIATKASSVFVDFAVLLNLKLKQQGLPDTGFVISEMDSQLYETYQKRRRDVKKEWQVLAVIKRIIDMWETPSAFSTGESKKSALQSDLKSAVSILELKEKIDKSSKNVRGQVAKTLNDLSGEINKVSRQLHEDRIPQLLFQMEDASALHGRYFYLALIFIATPLFVNLLILPQLSEATVEFFKPMISVTSLLSVMGVVFLLLYIHKILNV